MRPQLPTRFFIAWLVPGHGAGGRAQATVPPALEGRAENALSREGRGGSTSAEQGPPHEALQPSEACRDPKHVHKIPPSPIAERPGTLCPSPDARWIEEYWEWDESRKDFAWVTGTWVVPPPGKFWVNSSWRRDAKGWYRVPGLWSRGGQVQKDGRAQKLSPDGSRGGLPLIRPEEPIGMAPGPDFFYVPGEYIPGGGGVVWRPGFWVRSQPGWEWNPARRERWATGWVFREGFWNRDSVMPSPPPGNPPLIHGATLVSTATGLDPTPGGMNSRPSVPNNRVTPRDGGLNPSVGPGTGPGGTMTSTRSGEPGAAQLASRAETGQRPLEPSRSSQGGGATTQPGAPQQPSDPRSGPRPESLQRLAYVWYGSQPVYPPGRAMLWNARSVVGGFLRRVLP
jgi:hypothetical protein